MDNRKAGTMFLLAGMLLLATACGNNRDFSRGEVKPYFAEHGAVRAELQQEQEALAQVAGRR